MNLRFTVSFKNSSERLKALVQKLFGDMGTLNLDKYYYHNYDVHLSLENESCRKATEKTCTEKQTNTGRGIRYTVTCQSWTTEPNSFSVMDLVGPNNVI